MNTGKSVISVNGKDINLKGIVYPGIATLAMFLASYVVSLKQEDKQLAGSIVFTGLCILLFFVCLTAFVYLAERSRLRRAALHAFGKNGLKVVTTDKTARTIYKGIIRMFEGRLAESEELFHMALDMSDIRQNQLFCVEYLIKLYEQMGKEDLLMWGIRRAAELAPDNPEILSRLAGAYYSKGNLDNSEYYFNQILKYDPNYGYSYYSLSKIYMLRDEEDKAFEMLERLNKIQPEHPMTQAELAKWYAMHNDAAAAKKHYDQALLFGYQEPEKLSRCLTAIRVFNHAGDAEVSDLPAALRKKMKEQADTEDSNA